MIPVSPGCSPTLASSKTPTGAPFFPNSDESPPLILVVDLPTVPSGQRESYIHTHRATLVPFCLSPSDLHQRVAPLASLRQATAVHRRPPPKAPPLPLFACEETSRSNLVRPSQIQRPEIDRPFGRSDLNSPRSDLTDASQPSDPDPTVQIQPSQMILGSAT